MDMSIVSIKASEVMCMFKAQHSKLESTVLLAGSLYMHLLCTKYMPMLFPSICYAVKNKFQINISLQTIIQFYLIIIVFK